MQKWRTVHTHRYVLKCSKMYNTRPRIVAETFLFSSSHVINWKVFSEIKLVLFRIKRSFQIGFRSCMPLRLSALNLFANFVLVGIIIMVNQPILSSTYSRQDKVFSFYLHPHSNLFIVHTTYT